MKNFFVATLSWILAQNTAGFTAPRKPIQRLLVPRPLSSSTAVNGDETVSHLPEMRWNCPPESAACTHTGVTLSRFMREMARANPELEEIESIFTALQTACKTISSLIRKCSILGTTGLEGNVNVQGEEQKKLDVMTNDVLKNALEWTGHVGTLASEEEESPVAVDNIGTEDFSGNVLIEQEGSYVAVFDPLDGSSNVDANIPVVRDVCSARSCD